MSDDLWQGKTAWITSFWGWAPETWGTVSFTSEARRETVAGESTDPFIVVIYVTKGAPDAAVELRGKLAGFYLVSQVRGLRDSFTGQWHHDRFPEKWRYGLKALRAYSFLPEYQLHIDELDPSISRRAVAVGTYGEKLSAQQISRLKAIPYVEVPVFGGLSPVDSDIVVPAPDGLMVRAGPINRSGYIVPGEPIDTPKELYALLLSGSMPDYLKTPSAGRVIYKIGLSMSPATRLDAFRKAMPEGRFLWEAHRSTRRDGHDPYPTFEAAEAGERAIKTALSQSGEWLGGEFYAALPGDFEEAWRVGRAAALAYTQRGGNAG